MDITQNFERIAGRSPSTVGFSRRGGGRGVDKRMIGNVGDAGSDLLSGIEVHDYVKEVFGYTVIHSDGLRLQRTLPKSFPLTPWLVADSIGEMAGQGRMTKVGTDPSLVASSYDYAAFYPGQDISTNYAPVMYDILDDSAIGTGTLTWTKPDGTTGTSPYGYGKEWLRYTDVIKLPASEYITAQLGQFLFSCPTATPPHHAPAGDGQVKMLMRKTAYQIVWSEVPYEYIDYIDPSTGLRIESYIDQIIGHINQFTWHGFPAGTLLLTGVTAVRYPQIVPDYAYGNEMTAFASKKLCDITFNFLYTNPSLAAAPDAADVANANVIQAGHNLVPWSHTGLYYFASTVSTLPAVAKGRGIFPSAPFELLFTNPGISA